MRRLWTCILGDKIAIQCILWCEKLTISQHIFMSYKSTITFKKRRSLLLLCGRKGVFIIERIQKEVRIFFVVNRVCFLCRIYLFNICDLAMVLLDQRFCYLLEIGYLNPNSTIHGREIWWSYQLQDGASFLQGL